MSTASTLNRVAGAFAHPRARVSDSRLRRAVDGKAIVVTGASRGIGEATALRLGAAGARVVLAARSADRLAEVADAIAADGGEAHAVPADLTDAGEAEALAAEALERCGAVDVLVANAGKSINRSVAASTSRVHDYERTIAVNYLGPVRLVLALLPAMREHRSGQIVNVSTAGVYSAAPAGWTAYVASKQAFDTFLRGAAVELAGDGIDVTSIYMTLVETEMVAPNRDAFRYVPRMSAAQAADRVCAGIATRASRIEPVWGTGAAVGAQLSHLGFDRLQRSWYGAGKRLARRGRDRAPGEP